jgi:glycosyltransferase involved in cell wall biosynthesis
MKILMVAIPNNHFFQWVNQLKDSGHDVFWFDSTDGGGIVEKIQWVHQIKGWKLRWDFPFRHFIKSRFPKGYSQIQKINERKLAEVFEKQLQQIKPDVVQCFEMQLAGIPILEVMEEYSNIPLIYSSWGSDLFYHKEMGLSSQNVHRFLKRVDYLITDCHRDYKLALQNQFRNFFLGVYPGNGGIAYPKREILPWHKRNCIIIKGYDDEVGKALEIGQALELVDPVLLSDKKIIVFSADAVVKAFFKNSKKLQNYDVEIQPRNQFVPNEILLKQMGQSILYLGNSLSDGMPNSLLEAMGMGAFPIQSNPGGVTSEIIEHQKNGLLIANPLNVTEIAHHITTALQHTTLREIAQEYNVAFCTKNYDRAVLQSQIVHLYDSITV